MPLFPPRPGRTAALAALLLAAGALVPARAALPATPHVLPTASGQQQNAVGRVCGPARPGWRTCLAIVRNTVAAPAATSARSPRAASPTSLHGKAGGLTPYALATAYGTNANASTNQVVAVVDAFDDPRIWFELNEFDDAYDLPPETTDSFTRIDQRGGRSFPKANGDWAVEEALDVEAVRAICHHCRIRLVEADNSSAANLAQAVNTAVRGGATIVSNSYGGSESSAESPSIRQAYNHPGVVITASTGDEGWYGWDVANKEQAASDRPDVPAAYPEVVAVGGTKLLITPSGAPYGERVWNRNGQADVYGMNGGPQGASGGGCSHVYGAPSWQQALHGYQVAGCNGKRLVGDVAADADPNTGMDIYTMPTNDSGRWRTVGGTSLASPLIAGMWAVAGGAGGAAHPVQTLYRNQQTRSASYFDVQVGSNAFCGASDVLLTKSDCSADLKRSAGTGNPNDLAFRNGTWAGTLDCGWNFNGSAETLSNDKQCRAAPGYDGPSGLGAPRSVRFFQP